MFASLSKSLTILDKIPSVRYSIPPQGFLARMTPEVPKAAQVIVVAPGSLGIHKNSAIRAKS